MNTKYKCLRCELPICNKCSVFELNENVEGYTAGKNVAYCEACDRGLVTVDFSRLIQCTELTHTRA